MRQHIYDIEFTNGAIRFRIIDSFASKGIGDYPGGHRVIYESYLDRRSAIAIGSRFLKVANGLARVVKKNERKRTKHS